MPRNPCTLRVRVVRVWDVPVQGEVIRGVIFLEHVAEFLEI